MGPRSPQPPPMSAVVDVELSASLERTSLKRERPRKPYLALL